MGRSAISNEEYLRRQLTSQKGVNERQRLELVKLRAEVAKLRAQAPLNDKLIGILRMVRINGEMLQELLDKRTETSKIDYDVKSPDVHHKES